MSGAMPDHLEKLSYRDLADRLGISPDAARMKAKRKVKAGVWRLIPGNHPSDRVLIELPASDLNAAERVGDEQSQRIEPERSPRTQTPERENAIAEQMLVRVAEAQGRINELTDLLLKAHDAMLAAQAEHRRDAVELAAAEMRELGTKAELERALVDVQVLKKQLQMLMADRRQRRSWWRWW